MEGERQVFGLLGSCADATWRRISFQFVVYAQMRNRGLHFSLPGVEVQIIIHVIRHLSLCITALRSFARSAYLKRHEQVRHLQCFSTICSADTLFC